MSESFSLVVPGPGEAGADTPSKASSPQKRQAGASVLPMARVQRIIKADRDVDICSKEATFLISMATELFIKKLTDEAYTNARLDKRKVVQYKDLSRAVQHNEYLEFLKEAIPTPLSLSNALEARNEKLQQQQTEETMILEGTLQDEDEEEVEEEDEGEEDDAAETAEVNEGNQEDDEQEDVPAATSKASKKKTAGKKKSKAKQAEPSATDAMDEDQA
ncbi:histone-fold-containing protein [Testicularia cyperi]|uniref:Histone-fold-containing protein n=1 Tax=Testicularia cyperi TaxID=1882483 RepID=A0A317XR48_9BASI|nr:histone-fold-containing protein [Testicularia cyperi]